MKSLVSRQAIVIVSLLVLLMAVSRGSHFGSVFNLPDASLAVFFFAGFYFRSIWLFALFLLQAGLSDYVAITHGGVSDWCVTPAYFFLIPTYGCMWLAGRWMAQHQQFLWRNTALLAGIAVLGASIAFLISNGSFYLFSGRFPEMSWAEYAGRVAKYYPPYVGYACLYIALITGVHAVVKKMMAKQIGVGVMK